MSPTLYVRSEQEGIQELLLPSVFITERNTTFFFYLVTHKLYGWYFTHSSKQIQFFGCSQKSIPQKREHHSSDSAFPFIKDPPLLHCHYYIFTFIMTQTVSHNYTGSLTMLSTTQTHNKNTLLPSNRLQNLSVIQTF